MNIALEKTLTILGLMIIGLLLKAKVKNQEQINGLKEVVLSVALPAMIFTALLNIKVDSSFFWVPVFTLGINFILFLLSPYILLLFGVEKNSNTGRTLSLLIPSFAPGLSCFPFIAEFLGDKSLAIAALADVGNKIFVLVFLYVVALNMFLKVSKQQEQTGSQKIKELLLGLLKEPINLVLITAGVLLSFDVHYNDLPPVLQGIIDKSSSLMTPLILIYIGLAVQFKKGLKRIVLSVLTFRAGLSLLLSTALIYIAGIKDPTLALLALVIPQSSVSFWPFAHIAFFNQKAKIFEMEQAVLMLAFSLPYSTLVILGVLSSGTTFLNPLISLGVGLGLMTLSLLTQLYFKITTVQTKTA